ncbi:MAG TPA: hypothetical protein VFH54_11725 [Mycobacteriales bacterium]|nr:hypothetical protein [Mycobacteriales bacterium]
MSPNRLLSRYAPLVAVLAVQAMLVLAAPSGTSTSTLANGNGNGSNSSVGGGQNGGSNLPGGVNGSVSGGGGAAAGGGGGAAGGGGGAAGGGGTTASGPIGNTSHDMSRCDKNGHEIGVVTYMPACVPVWHGNNGGSTMQGVTGTQIKYVYWVAQANAEVNAILAQEQLAASSEQICESIQAWNTDLNKRYDFYGRKLVSLDGPGNNAGSKNQSNCHFAYFQSQCSLTPPDENCLRAEADTIARMHPAVVFATADGALVYRLAQEHVVTLTGNLAPETYYDQLKPYLYGLTNGTFQAQAFAEYWCKKMSGRPVQFAGTGVGDAGAPATPGGKPPIRKIGILYYLNPSDHTGQDDANYLKGLITGGECGKPGDAFTISYASDITTAQQQTNTYIAEMKQNHATDATCVCDPIAPVFGSHGEKEQNYHPENVGMGSGLLDYDVLAQLYDQDVWNHTLGLSNIGNPLPFDQSDAVKAWHDAGRTGEPDKTENLSLTYYEFMGLILMAAGPDLTPQNIASGLMKEPELGGGVYYASWKFTPKFPYSAEYDVREVSYCSTKVSPINGQPGSYYALLGGHRFKQGEMTSSLDGAFPGGMCHSAS